MRRDLPSALRLLVEERAKHRCEYCLFPESFAGHRHEPDHIIPVQHGGQTDASNLALACWRCNRYKGPNIGSFDPDTGILTPFFNPRLHQWQAHFEWHNGEIRPRTPEARVTVLILRINDPERVEERKQLIALDLYET
jgi:hypothetical protein